ncbi:hypothetical protein Btru_043915 [Bulinus truncatus]|nr:hypothetical protein Btru_043915 [Bulinus truncatus]
MVVQAFPGRKLDVTVHILKPDVVVPVEVALINRPDYYLSNNITILQSATGNFTSGVAGTLSIPIDVNVKSDFCRLRIRGYNPVQFETERYIEISNLLVTILIQTDKAIYKPNERVNFRILAVYSDLKLYKGTFHLEIRDPSDSKINVLKGLNDSSGVVLSYFDLSDQPAFGTWRIDVKTENVSGYESLSFEVADYGMLCPSKINGNGNFSVPLEDVQRSISLVDGKQVRVTAFVTETSTGIKLNGSSVITYYENKYKLKFLDLTPAVFKPGLQYTAFIQVSTPDDLPPATHNLIADSNVNIKITGTEAINMLMYEIKSRGSTVDSGLLDLNGQKEFTYKFNATPAMAPTAQMLIYYIRNSDEVVADSLAFNVEGIFNNKVSVSFKENETDVNKNVTVELTADPHSQIYVLAVDQSVLLVKTGNDITPKKVKDSLAKFTKGEIPKDSDYALAYSARTMSTVFSKMNLNIITDLDLPSPLDEDFINRRPPFARSGLQGPPIIDGKASITTTVPDTITSWVVSAFATNNVSGLGVAPTTSKLRVFRPFFVSLTYPRSVTRNELFVVQATVFNYLTRNLSVTVSLADNSFLKANTSCPQVFHVLAPSQEQGVVYFPLSASVAGLFDIEVTAASALARDAVVRQILVKHEGAPVIYNYPVFISLSNNQSDFEKNVAFSLPDSVVQGSQKVRVKVTGDLIGSSLQSLTSLLALPTGCGEQVMVKFSPNIYIGRYLKATGQLTGELNKRITDLLSDGYQRLLGYKRYDNGFSAFGNFDMSSSTWLTAFVIRSLVEAQEFIYVDPEVILKTADWIADRQNLDGSFNDVGKVIDRNTQGTATGPSLTAFVLLALLEAKQLTAEKDCSPYRSCRYYHLGNATLNATRNLEHLALNDTIDNQFSLAVSYALAEAKSLLSDQTFRKLLTFSKMAGSLMCWSANRTIAEEQNKFIRWRPLQIQARPIDILITSYAALTYTSLDRVDEALPTIKWLVSQKNANGGFVSTQDTVLGLQALSAFATKSLRPDSNINITVSDQGILLNFNVHSDNALSLEIQESQNTGQDFSISATGLGLALLDVEYSFNVLQELSAPAFQVSIVLLDDKLDSFNIMVCTKFVLKRETGMVVQEISIPSGFVPDLTTLAKVAGVKRSERRGYTVAVYFDKISGSSLCYSFVMVRESKVARSQKNYVRTYDYYEPANQATVFYQPRAIRDSTICDVCPNCCP